MRIDHNSEIASFLSRCRENLGNNSLNEYLDHKVTPGNETYLRKKLAKAGAAEFFGPEVSWPSLFLSSEDWMKTPYHSRIHLEKIEDEHFSYETMRVLPGRLFNLDEVQPDPKRELNDWMKLRAMDQAFETAVLYQDDDLWMIDAPSEALTNDPMAVAAHGNALTFGLGIGYFLYMASLNPKTECITAVEKSESVIRMFETCLLPQFDHPEKIRLIHGDAMDYWNEEFLSGFDTIYADIWQSGDDGLFWISRLLSQYHPDDEKTFFWIEESCLVALRTVVFLHFEELYYRCEREVSEDYRPLLEKTRAYFRRIDKSIDSVDALKHFLYDRTVLRAILGEKI